MIYFSNSDNSPIASSYLQALKELPKKPEMLSKSRSSLSKTQLPVKFSNHSKRLSNAVESTGKVSAAKKHTKSLSTLKRNSIYLQEVQVKKTKTSERELEKLQTAIKKSKEQLSNLKGQIKKYKGMVSGMKNSNKAPPVEEQLGQIKDRCSQLISYLVKSHN